MTKHAVSEGIPGLDELFEARRPRGWLRFVLPQLAGSKLDTMPKRPATTASQSVFPVRYVSSWSITLGELRQAREAAE